MRHRVPVIGAAALVAVLSLSACSGSGATANPTGAAKQKSGNTFILGITGNIPNLSPQPATSTRFMLREAVFNTLVDYVGGKAVPELATAWKASTDGLTYTFTLRDDVKFTDGKKFVASDGCDNIKFAQDLANGVQGAGLLTGISCASPSATKMVLTLPSRLPQLLSLLVNIPIMDLTSKDDVASKPYGTGPYEFSDFKPGSEIDMVRNPDYWGKPAIVKNYVLKMFSDSASAIIALKGGAIQALQAPPSSQADDLRSTPNVKLVTLPGYGNYQYNLNVTQAPLNDIRVRQAISLAVDRNAFADATSGLAKPSASMWPPTSPAYNKADDTPQYNLKKAKALLKEAGYTSGFSIDITNSKQSSPEFADFGPVFQADLAKIGIKANLIDLEATDKNTRANTGDYSGLITNIYAFSNLDPALAFAASPFQPAGNTAKFSSPEYTKMVAAAQAELDPKKRIQDYRAIGKYVQKEDFQITVASNPIVFAVRSSVKNFSTNSYGMPLVDSLSVVG